MQLRSHIVSQFKQIVDKKPDESHAWIETHFRFLAQDDLLTQGGGCPCGACHVAQRQTFQNFFHLIDHQQLKKFLRKAIITSTLRHNVFESAWVILEWLAGHDPQFKIKPFVIMNPVTGENLLHELDQESIEKLYGYGYFTCSLKVHDAVTSSLRNIDVPQDALNAYSSYCYDNYALPWLSGYAPQLKSPKPAIDHALSFGQRWALYKQSGSPRFIDSYFNLADDRNALQLKVVAADNANQILDAFPTGKLSWKRLKKSCETTCQP